MIEEDPDLEHIEESRQNLSPIFPILRGHGSLWHRTSVCNLKSILESGAILPNDGRFPYTYPQSRSCYSFHLGAISIFDFDTRSEIEIYRHAWKWASFLADQGTATVLIRLDRTKLEKDKLILPGAHTFSQMTRIKENGVSYIPTSIPEVEAFYQSAIPVSAFHDYLLVKEKSGYELSCIPFGPNSLLEIENYQLIWAKEIEQKRLNDRTNGVFDIGDLIMSSLKPKMTK